MIASEIYQLSYLNHEQDTRYTVSYSNLNHGHKFLESLSILNRGQDTRANRF